MAKFYHTLAGSAYAGTNSEGIGFPVAPIELNGDVLGYEDSDRVINTAIAPTGVEAGTYTRVRVNTKGQVIEGYNDPDSSSVWLAIDTFFFYEPSLIWVVKHNLNTTNFQESIKDANGDKIYADVRIIDANEFWVFMTEESTGSVTVNFELTGNANNEPTTRVVAQTFRFNDPSTRWVIKHNMNTRNFTESIKNIQGARLNANINVVSANEFWVELTEPDAGSVTVNFEVTF
jgi:hypothetical protein